MARTKTNQLDLLRAIEAMDADERPTIGYSTSVLTQTNLPYQNPKGDVWARRNGDLHLIVTPGMESDGQGGYRSIGFPYGVMPRLLIAWFCREALLTQSPVLELRDSMRGFMAELNLRDSGGKTGNRNRLRDQLKRLMSATLTIEWGNTARHDGKYDIRVGKGMNVWWHDPDGEGGGQGPADGSTITLSTDFFDEIMRSPVPLNMAAMHILSGSPMRLDIYAWLTYRLHQLDRPIVVPWAEMMAHFGTKPSTDRRAQYDFKRDFKDHLDRVLAVYHEARVRVTDNGLLLQPSAPHVPFRGTHGLRRAVKTAGRAGTARRQLTGGTQPTISGLDVSAVQRPRAPRAG